MKKSFLIVITLLAFSFTKMNSQVVVSPENGISYSSYLIDSGRFINGSQLDNSKRLDYLIGFSVQLPVHKKWYVDTRLTYQNRKEAKWSFCGILFCSDYFYKHSNLNLDLRLFHDVTPSVSIGMGPSIIRKFNSVLTIDNENGQGEKNKYNRDFNYFGLNAGVSFDFKSIRLNIDYTQKFSSYHLLYAVSKYRSRSRFNLTISVPLITGK